MNAPAAFYHVESPYVWRNIRERIMARKDEMSHDLANGLAASYEDYRYRVGVMAGLNEALFLIDELEKYERN